MPISPNGWKECGFDDSPPPRPLSARTRMEQWAGRKHAEFNRLRATLPAADYLKYVAWNAMWDFGKEK